MLSYCLEIAPLRFLFILIVIVDNETCKTHVIKLEVGRDRIKRGERRREAERKS